MNPVQIILPTEIDLDEFVSVYAHDLRTPFNHIIGFSKMILNHLGDGPLSDFQKEDLGTVYRSGLRALALTNGLIDIARLRRREIQCTPVEVIIQQTLESSLADWNKNYPAAGMKIVTHVEAQSTCLHADEQLIRKIICGLIAYVAQFVETGAEITLQLEENPDVFRLTFSSAGRKTRQASEMDLKLLGYVERAFVELHGGKVDHAEENEVGALVRVWLPKA